MKIQRFEDLECWKSARVLVREIYLLTHSARFDDFRDLRWQLQSASLSVMNNIAEGFDRFHTKDSMRFLNFSSASCGEVRSMLYVCSDLNILSIEDHARLMTCAQSTQRLTLGLIRHMRSR